MADDNDDWFSSADEPAAPAAAPAAAAATESSAPAAATAEVGAASTGGAATEEKKEEAADEEYLDPDKLLLFKHWIRPKFFQYKYIYDYRQNYYNDVMEVVERRRKGYRREIPRPQSWAERVLRTHSDPLHKLETFDRQLEDIKLVTRSRISGAFHSHYLKESFNKRCTRLEL